ILALLSAHRVAQNAAKHSDVVTQRLIAVRRFDDAHTQRPWQRTATIPEIPRNTPRPWSSRPGASAAEIGDDERSRSRTTLFLNPPSPIVLGPPKKVRQQRAGVVIVPNAVGDENHAYFSFRIEPQLGAGAVVRAIVAPDAPAARSRSAIPG